MAFIDEIKAKAKSNKKTVILPESMDRRTFEAAAEILAEDIADLIIIGTDEEVKANSEGLDISKATIINPHTYEKTKEYINGFYELRKAKGMTPEEAEKTLLSDYMYYACMMVKMGDGDGIVSGACHSTANTLRPSLQIIKTAPGTKLVSAFFVMVVPNCEYGEDGVFVFGDCGLVQNPNPEELAAIAGSSAASFKQLVGKEPVVALLSHSSMGSAKHDDVTKVVEATKIAKEEYPQLYDQPLKRNNSSFMKSLRYLKERYFNRAKLPDCSIKAVSNKDHNFISFCLFLSEYGLSRRTYDIIIQDSKVQSLSLIKEELIQSHSTVLQF